MELKKLNLSYKKKLLLALFIALVMEFSIGVVLVNAQVTEPVFTTGNDLAGVVTEGEIIDFSGQDYWVATTTDVVGDCIGTKRIGQMQWFGSSFSYTGGGSSLSCLSGQLFLDIGDTVFINLLTATDGYYCNIYGNDTPLIESTHKHRICVSVESGVPTLYDPENKQNLIIPPTNPQLNFNTKFTDATAVGVASTSISLDVDYLLDTSEYTANTRPDFISIIVLADGFFGDQQIGGGRKLILPLSDGSFTKNVPVENYQTDSGGFDDGNYLAHVNFYNINTSFITFSYTNVTVSFTVSGGVVTNSVVLAILDGEVLDTIEYENCSISNLSGCFQNAMIYVFVPEPDSLSQFTTLYERVQTKPPFGYVTSLTTALGGVTVGTSSAFTFGAVPFLDTIFDPFKSLLAIGLWVIYALFWMGRLDKLDI